MSQITTHVLDTSRGIPASGVPITLFQKKENEWTKLASGITNSDGRIGEFLPKEQKLAAGIYRMHFQTESYFNSQKKQGFYPYVDVVFQLDDSGSHYHVPLLLSAFGYSTYRGS